MNSKQIFKVEKAGELLDTLFELFSDHPKKTVKTWLKQGRVVVGDRVETQFNAVLEVGNELRVFAKSEKIPRKKLVSKTDIIYDDKNIIVVNKPHNYLTVGLPDSEEENLLSELLSYENGVMQLHPSKSKQNGKQKNKLEQDNATYKKPILSVHRLDKETTGLVVFAKDLSVKRSLVRYWSECQKYYLAVVEGVYSKEEDRLVDYLEETDNHLMRVAKGSEGGGRRGKESIIELKCLGVNKEKNISLLKIELITGRKNQIRVQLAHRQHSVVGDTRYYSKVPVIVKDKVVKNKILLHCYRLKVLYQDMYNHKKLKKTFLRYPSGHFFNGFENLKILKKKGNNFSLDN